MNFHSKTAWPPATFNVISHNHSNWPWLNLSQNAHDKQTATKKIRCWCFIIRKMLGGGKPSLPSPLSYVQGLRSLLTDNPPSPGNIGHTTGVYVPYSFQTVVWVLLHLTRTSWVKVLWDGTYSNIYCPYPRRLESLTICRCHNKGSTFLTQSFKDLSVGPTRIWTCNLLLSRPVLSQLGC